MLTKLVIFVGILIISFAVYKSQKESPIKDVEILESYYTSGTDQSLNVDSLVVYHQKDRDWLIATAKSSNELLVYNAINGTLISKVSRNFNRPNGIQLFPGREVICIVERDSHRIQVLSLPNFEILATFGEDLLKRPYGLDILKVSDTEYHVYVTDNYMIQEYSEKHGKMRHSKLPPLDSLNERVKVFQVLFDTNVKIKHLFSFGDTTSDGVLYKVETIMVDEFHKRIMIADEQQVDIKVYSLNGKYLSTFGKNIFKVEPEGFALYRCPNGEGVWIMTDQFKHRTKFHLFDRRSLKHLGSFQGTYTANTDGVGLSQKEHGSFHAGAFYALHLDGGISAFSWANISDKLNVANYCE
jgi:3-phytase